MTEDEWLNICQVDSSTTSSGQWREFAELPFLSPFWSNFRAGHSNVSAVILVMNDTALDKRKHCAALCVDLSRAFGTVDHHLILQRLHDIGFDHTACNWFRNSLYERQQSVKLGNYQSEFSAVTRVQFWAHFYQ